MKGLPATHPLYYSHENRLELRAGNVITLNNDPWVVWAEYNKVAAVRHHEA
jgi:hypothetical protein